MRIEIRLRPIEGDTVLPFNYNYEVYSQLVSKISIVSPGLAKEIETSTVDPFTFSRIMVRRRELVPEMGIRILSDEVSLYVSSYSQDIIRGIAEGFLEDPHFEIKNASFMAEDIRVLKEPRFKSPLLFSTLSPILVRTVKFVNGKMRIWDLYPNDDAFFDKLRKILLRNYSTLYGKMPEERDFRINVLKFKPVRILVKDTYYRSSLMVFEYSGSLELARLAYEIGFGERTRYGFGMVKVIDEGQEREFQE